MSHLGVANHPWVAVAGTTGQHRVDFRPSNNLSPLRGSDTELHPRFCLGPPPASPVLQMAGQGPLALTLYELRPTRRAFHDPTGPTCSGFRKKKTFPRQAVQAPSLRREDPTSLPLAHPGFPIPARVHRRPPRRTIPPRGARMGHYFSEVSSGPSSRPSDCSYNGRNLLNTAINTKGNARMRTARMTPSLPNSSGT